jgi:hypothetical protein
VDVVGLCNAALGLVGAGAITSLSDASTPAELCTLLYPICRDSVLEEREWTFAVERRHLALDGTAPDHGWTKRYLIPSGTLRVLDLDDGYDDTKWVREGQYIVCDEDGPIHVRLLTRVEDPALWSPGFTMALTYRLASALAGPLTENRSKEESLYTQYKAALRSAAANDGMQGRSQVLAASPIARARW